jgi:hypothetical protein
MKSAKHRETSGKSAASTDSIWKLLRSLTGNFIRMLPGMWLRMLLISTGLFIFIFFMNYYIIAVMNQGYGSGAITGTNKIPWIWFFNVGDNKPAVNMIAFFLPLLLSSLWRQIRRHGVRTMLSNLVHTPHWTGACLHHAGRFSLPSLMASIAVIFLLGVFVSNDGLFLTLAMGTFFAFMSQNNNLVFCFASAGWNDWQRLFRKNKPMRPLNPGVGGFIPLGFLLGLVVLLLLPEESAKIISGILSFLLLAGTLYLLKSWQHKSALATVLVLLGVHFFWLLLTGRSFADDAGADELGTFGNYIRDPGGQMVLKSGLVPGGLSVAGVWIGQLDGLYPPPGDVAGTTVPSDGPNQDEAAPHEAPLQIFVFPGGPGENPFTSFEGENPCR